MAIVKVSLEEARLRGRIDRAKVEAMSEAEIARFNAADGFDPVDTLQGLRPSVSPAGLRVRLGLSQRAFAKAIGIPLATLRNWEQGRTPPDPAARSLLALVDADPAQALKVLAG